MTVEAVNGNPVGCNDCGAWPTIVGHECPPTTEEFKRISLRVMEWARAGRELYKREAMGDKPVLPSEVISTAEEYG